MNKINVECVLVFDVTVGYSELVPMFSKALDIYNNYTLQYFLQCF